MTCCLNPNCQHPQNPDDADYCLSCGAKLTLRLRDRYRVLHPLGQGGFGRTYLAVDEDRLGSRCVIKQFSPTLQGTKAMEKATQLFEQEAVRLHDLGEHPQIPALLAYFKHEEHLYLVQQFIEGYDLVEELHQQGPFSEQKVREILARLLPVLKFIHDRQVIHRDITPSNIIRRKSDNKLVLIDFGVAKLLSSESSTQVGGTKIGTEGYAPIEQLRSGKAYPASDLYSLAATCIYLLTRTRPDDLYDPLEGRWLWRERLSQQGGGISEPIAQILDRMLKDLVGERYASADAVMKDLRTALSTPVALRVARAKSAPPLPRTSNPPSSPPSNPPSRPPSQPAQPMTVVQPNPSKPPSKPPIPPPSGPANLPAPAASSGSGNLGQGMMVLKGHLRWVMAVAISPDGLTIASGGLDDTIRIWDARTGALSHTLMGHTKPVNSLTFTPDSQMLLSGSDDGTIRVWSMATTKFLRSLAGHTRDVNAVVVHGDGQLVASGSDDRTVRLWDVSNGQLLRTFTGTAGMIRSIALSPDAEILASGGLDHQIKLWNLNTTNPVRAIPKGHFGAVNALVISPDGRLLISGSKDKTIKVWNLATCELIRTLNDHHDTVTTLAMSPDGERLVSGSSDRAVKLWNPNSGKLLATFSDHTNAVNAVAISRDRRFIASGSSDNTVRIRPID